LAIRERRADDLPQLGGHLGGRLTCLAAVGIPSPGRERRLERPVVVAPLGGRSGCSDHTEVS